MIESFVLMRTFRESHFPLAFMCIRLYHCISLYHVIKPLPQCRGCGECQNQKHTDLYVFYEKDLVVPLMQSQQKWKKVGVQKLERIDDDLQVVSSWSVLQVSVHVSWYLSNPIFSLRPSFERQTQPVAWLHGRNLIARTTRSPISCSGVWERVRQLLGFLSGAWCLVCSTCCYFYFGHARVLCLYT